MTDKTVEQIVEYARANPDMSCGDRWSNCCALPASRLSDDICGGCLEHAEFIDHE